MKFDFTSFCKKNNIDVRLAGEHKNSRDGWEQVCCPFCNDNNFHMGHPTGAGFLNCYKCGTHTLWDYLDKLGFNPAQELREFRFNWITPKQYKQKKHPVPGLPLHITNKSQAHDQYLIKRGFNPFELQKRWGVLYARRAPVEYAWRIMIPIFDKDSRYVGFTSRAISDMQSPKYRTAPRFQPKDYLYGENLVMGDDQVIVTEGPADVWVLGPGAVCLFGVNYSSRQIEKLSRYKRVIICFDSDNAGRRAAKKLKRDLDLFSEVIVADCSLYGGTDPGSIPESNRKEFRRHLEMM